MGMLGAVLVYVGFVLCMNGLKVLGKLKAKHVIPMNLFTGTLIVAGVMRTVLLNGEGITPYFYAMQSLLFGFTYLWIGINSIWDLEDDGLGWYCLLVSIVAVPTAFTTMPDVGMVVNAVGKSMVYVFPAADTTHKDSKDYGVLDNY